MPALVLEPWSGSYTSNPTSSSFSDFSFDDINWEGGSHEEDAIRLLKSIMEPAEIPDPPRRSRRRLERRVRDGGAAKRPREVEEDLENPLALEKEEEESCDNPSNISSFYFPSSLSSTPVVTSGDF